MFRAIYERNWSALDLAVSMIIITASMANRLNHDTIERMREKKKQLNLIGKLNGIGTSSSIQHSMLCLFCVRSSLSRDDGAQTRTSRPKTQCASTDNYIANDLWIFPVHVIILCF